jgi:hypothetical protein
MNEPVLSSTEGTEGHSIETLSSIFGSTLERDSLWLLNAVKGLFELPPQANIYQVIAMFLKDSIENSIVIVIRYNDQKNTLCVRAASGIGPQIDELICILSKHLIGMSVPMSFAARNGLTMERLERVDGGIYELATGSIPASLCNNIIGVLNVTDVYAMGLIWRGRLMGSAAILMRNNCEIRNAKTIETFLNYAAAVLQKRDRPPGE